MGRMRRMSGKRGMLLAALLGGTLLLAGCAGNQSQLAAKKQKADQEGQGALTALAPTPEGQAGGSGSASEQAPLGGTMAKTSETTKTKQTVDLKLSDFRFTPDTIRTEVGTVLEIRAENVGTVVHEIVVDTGEGEFETELKPGETKTFNLVFHQPGEYAFKCEQPGHLEQGMEGTIVVTGQAAEPRPEIKPTEKNPSSEEYHVMLKLSEFKFEPAEIVSEAKTLITVDAENVGTVSHEFVLEGKIANFEKEFAPGEKMTFGFRFRVPGTYEYKCEIPGHLERGMKGKVVLK